MTIRHIPVIAALMGICILTSPNVEAEGLLSDQPDWQVKSIWTTPLRKIASAEEHFKANHQMFTNGDYGFDVNEFFASGRNLLAYDSTSTNSQSMGTILASLSLMALIARRRSYNS